MLFDVQVNRIYLVLYLSYSNNDQMVCDLLTLTNKQIDKYKNSGN